MSTVSLTKYKFQVHKIKYILLMFFSTRVMLTIIGLLSHRLSGSDPEGFTGYSWLNLWGHWDTGWYLNIAQYGYTARTFGQLISQQTNIVFFPLYPLLMRFLGSITGNHYVAGIIISNFCLIVSCIYLYRLVKLDSDEANAIKSIKYLLIFPISFILSGCFTESLYLLLTLMCFYYARTSKWQLAGIAGFFLSLTKSMGVLVLLPLLYEGLVPLLKENKDLILLYQLHSNSL